MQRLIPATTKSLAAWLSKVMPQIGENWWQDHVIERLTYAQQRQAQERNFREIADLDLAALLSVID